jgi:GNAT superfamily N-acetyltransferase
LRLGINQLALCSKPAKPEHLTVNITLRKPCDDDVAFARNLYFETMREIIERLFGWDENRETMNFAQFFKLDEVRVITADGQDVGWIQEQVSDGSINLGSFYVAPTMQCRGIGTRVLQMLMERAAKESKVMTLAVVKHRRFTRDQFQYAQVENVFRCPQGQTLRYRGMDHQAQGYLYQTAESQCRGCPVKKRCTRGSTRRIFVHWHEPARQAARELARRERNKIEALFSELKLRVGLRRVRLRRLWNVAEPFYLAATAQNLKRLIRFLAERQSAPIPCST